MIERFEHFSYAINEINKYWHKIAGLSIVKTKIIRSLFYRQPKVSTFRCPLSRFSLVLASFIKSGGTLSNSPAFSPLSGVNDINSRL